MLGKMIVDHFGRLCHIKKHISYIHEISSNVINQHINQKVFCVKTDQVTFVFSSIYILFSHPEASTYNINQIIYRDKPETVFEFKVQSPQLLFWKCLQ